MSKEIWKDIKGYEGCYQVSNLGRIRSLDRYVPRGKYMKKLKGVTLRPHIKKIDGYAKVTLCKNGEVKDFAVHRLVGINFIDNPDNKPQINHINSVRTDNNVENLEWVTPRENISHGNINKGTSKYVGVSWDKNKNKWKAYITVDSKDFYLGGFNNEDDAGQAYKLALEKYNIKNKYA